MISSNILIFLTKFCRMSFFYFFLRETISASNSSYILYFSSSFFLSISLITFPYSNWIFRSIKIIFISSGLLSELSFNSPNSSFWVTCISSFLSLVHLRNWSILPQDLILHPHSLPHLPLYKENKSKEQKLVIHSITDGHLVLYHQTSKNIPSVEV